MFECGKERVDGFHLWIVGREGERHEFEGNVRNGGSSESMRAVETGASVAYQDRIPVACPHIPILQENHFRSGIWLGAKSLIFVFVDRGAQIVRALGSSFGVPTVSGEDCVMEQEDF